MGDLREMYRRPLTNISHALLSLFINVPKNLQEMLPYFHKILYIFETEYSTSFVYLFSENKGMPSFGCSNACYTPTPMPGTS